MFQPNASSSSSGGTGSGSKNYLAVVVTSNGTNVGNGDFELGATTGWNLGTVTLTNGIPTGIPSFSSGASGNLSISTMTAGSQIAGTYSLSYLSSAATTAGNFLHSSAFFIDQEDQAKVMTFKFYYQNQNSTVGNWSGTSSNSFGVAIWDQTNSAWIVPAGGFGMTQNTGCGYCTGTFQTTSNSTSYRLVIYNANATASGITVYFDDFVLGPQTAPIGVPASDGVSFAPVINGFVTVTNQNASWWRIGDSLRMRGFAIGSSALGANFGLCFPQPWMTVDSTKVGISTYQLCGELTNTNAGTGLKPICIGGATGINYTAQGTSLLAQLANVQFAVNSNFTFDVQVPITGWSSNVQMSPDTDTRVVSLSASNNAGSATANTAIAGWTINKDTHGAFVTGGTYTVPVSGDYVATFMAATTSGTPLAQIYKNGALFAKGIGSGVRTIVTVELPGLVAGDLITPRLDTTLTLTSTATDTLFSINRLSGPSVVAATESVSMGYNTSVTSTTTGTPTQLAFTVKEWDTHNAFSSNNLYTVPVSGKYLVMASAQWAGATSNQTLFLFKNGSSLRQLQQGTSGAIQMSGCTEVSCVAGDTLAVYGQQLSGGTVLLNGSSSVNWIQISRVGN